MIGDLWFESFEFHLKTRRRYNHLSTKEEYIEKIKDVILNYDSAFYVYEKNGYGKFIDKIYFGKDKWTVVVKFNKFNKFKIITSFKLDYKNVKHYLDKRSFKVNYVEVKNGTNYEATIKEIQRRIEP